ncbi:MAG TPA: hypothetical protein P5555_18785 [Candidatus Paceibacterota bacterium]|nr:hypothetical protein [Verrucomicrobiota bacterium]HRZ47232.1 hypothetical protein [Candidatus Paceibacterota bacterium]
MLGAIRSPALRRQPASLIPVIVEREHRHGLTDDETVRRNGDAFLEGLTKGPKLLVLSVRIDGDRFDESIRIRFSRSFAVGVHLDIPLMLAPPPLRAFKKGRLVTRTQAAGQAFESRHESDLAVMFDTLPLESSTSSAFS